ncbi:MAG: hypothetical protein ACR2FJ_04465 [Qipengyuania sp.]
MPIAFPMEMPPPALLQFLGSLAAILVLAGIVRWLGLGAPSRFTNHEEVTVAADEVHHGFAPVATAIDREGRAALARNAIGDVMLLRFHGNKVAGRLVGPGASAALAGERLRIDTGEPRFGAVELEIENASAWMQAIDTIKPAHHA